MKSAAPSARERMRPGLPPETREALLERLSAAMREGYACGELEGVDNDPLPDCRLLEANESFARCLGLSPAAVRGRTLRELLPDTAPAWVEACLRAAREGRAAYPAPANPGWPEELALRVLPLGGGRVLLLLEGPEVPGLLEGVWDAAAIVDAATGLIVEANASLKALTGLERERLIGQPLQSLLQPEGGFNPLPLDTAGSYAALLPEDGGAVREIELRAWPLRLEGRGRTMVSFHERTGDRRDWWEGQTSLSLLRMLNERGGARGLIRSFTRYLQKWSGCEAVAVRLKEGTDYPYFETRGFPAGFLNDERRLCRTVPVREQAGGETGILLPGCLCGRVLAGSTDPRHPFFSTGGSFWTNSLSGLLASPAGQELEGGARNRCRAEGFESVAFIPLRVRGEILGLVQLGDRRRGRLSAGMIRFLERTADQAAVVLDQRETRAALREREEQFRKVVENAPFPVLVYADDGRILAISRAVTRITGYRRRELRTFEDWTRLAYGSDPEQMEEVRRRVRSMFETGRPMREAEWVVTTRSGRKRVWMFAEATPGRFGRGRHYLAAIAVDITERKAAEQALHRLNERLEKRVSERTAVAERRARQLQSLAVQLIEAEERERQRIGSILHDDLQQILAAAKRKLFWLKDAPEDLQGLMEEAIQKARRLSYELNPSVLRYAGFAAALEWLARQMKEQYGLEVALDTGNWKDEAAEPVKMVLFRAVQELLFNVVKHAGVQQAAVSLSEKGGRLKVAVTDEGQGFEPRSLANLEGRATGIGLVSIRERIGSIGGSLSIRSVPGKRQPLHHQRSQPAEDRRPGGGCRRQGPGGRRGASSRRATAVEEGRRSPRRGRRAPRNAQLPGAVRRRPQGRARGADRHAGEPAGRPGGGGGRRRAGGRGAGPRAAAGRDRDGRVHAADGRHRGHPAHQGPDARGAGDRPVDVRREGSHRADGPGGSGGVHQQDQLLLDHPAVHLRAAGGRRLSGGPLRGRPARRPARLSG